MATLLVSLATSTPSIEHVDPDKVIFPLPGTQLEQVYPQTGQSETRLIDEDAARREREAAKPHKRHENIDAPERWAHLFAEGESAGRLTDNEQLNGVLERISRLQAKGYKIDRVAIEGHASAEDEAPDGGLTTPSDLNRGLAAERGADYKHLLKGELSRHHVKGLPALEVTAPVEDSLTTAQMEHMNGLAARFGYSEPVSMISAYNSGQDMPEAVKSYLDKMLNAERKVVVTIMATKPGHPLKAEPYQESHDTTLPQLFFFPILVPLFRRRKPGEEELDAAPEPEAAPIAEPLTALIPEPVTVEDEKIVPTEAAITSAAVIVPTVVRSAKDRLFRERAQSTDGRPREAVERINQPRPHNMHGTKGYNRHQGRARGGNRMSRTSPHG